MSRLANWGVGALVLLSTSCTSGTAAHEPTGGQPGHYQITGTVLGQRNASTITLAHDAIEHYMPAMAMDFRGDALPPLRTGDRIRATLVVTGETSRLADVVVVDSGSTRPAGEAVPAQPTRLGGIVPDVTLVNQSGKTIRLQDFRGRVLIVTFIYTRCPLPDFCPRLMRNVQELRRTLTSRAELLGRIHTLTVSIDPQFDTPPVLRAYANAVLGSNQTFDWIDFATGEPAQIANLATSLGLRYEPANGQIVHTMMTAIIGADGRLVKQFPEMTWDLTAAMAVLQREAARPSSE